MTSHQAKEILLLYRAGTADAAEPEFAEALALAEQDPELGRWLEEQAAVQAALREKFRQIPVLEGLKEQILSERKVHTALPWRRTVVLTAAVATIVILLGILAVPVLQNRQQKSFANFRARMVRTVARQYPKMDLETNDLAAIERFVAERQGQASYQLPESLRKTRTTGCALLQWRNNPVTMICFNSGRSPKLAEPDLFLFVIDRANAPYAPQSTKPQFSQNNRMATASWSLGDKAYVLAGLGDEEFLRRYF